MTLGEKIRYLRNQRKMTQARLAGDKITRNMLSAIESDKANPSLETLKYLANALSVPLPYLLSVENDYYLYEKNERIEEIYTAYSLGSYKSVVRLAEKLSRQDDEIHLILAYSHLELGKEDFKRGAMKTASENFMLSLEHSEKTLHSTGHIESVAAMHLSIIKNMQAPLLELDSENYNDSLNQVFEYDLYKYITQDNNHGFKNKVFDSHLKAKKLIKERNYNAAIDELLFAAEENAKKGYDAFIMFSIYADLEICYKQLYDFENAYKYSSKRLSLIEGFKS